MIRAMYRSGRGVFYKEWALDKWGAALRDRRGVLWVDFFNSPKDECELLMREVFGFHPLAIDDALCESHVPKVDDWGEYLYIGLHGINFKREWQDLDTDEVDIFLGHNFLVTFHREPIAAIERARMLCERDERRARGGPDHLMYDLVDGLVADYMPVVDELDEAIDLIEDEVFARPTPNTLARIFALKRAVLHLRRILAPQREVLDKLARDDYAVIDAKDRIYFRDVYDHVVRLYDLNESLRDLVGGALDTYLSVSSNRINEIMKVLTVVTTLFMPISFLTGFFGMNFFSPSEDPGWANRNVLVAALSMMAITPLAMIAWLRKQGWL